MKLEQILIQSLNLENNFKWDIKNKNNQRYTDVLWIGIGGSGLGPLLITESLQKCSKGLNFLISIMLILFN